MKKHHILSIFLIFLLAMLFSACASVSTMQTPAVVPEGEIRWAIASTGTGTDGENVASSAEPNFEVAMRYGVAHNVDIGLKLDFLGAQIGAKYQILGGDFDLAIGLEAGYQWLKSMDVGGEPDDPSTHLILLQLPVLMEYHFNPYVGLAFGPKFMGLIAAKSDDRADLWKDSGFYGGLMIGLPLRLTTGVWFMPEFNIYTNFYDESDSYFDRVLWQAGVSVFFGGL